MIYTSYYESPLGKILLASQDNKLIGLWLEGQKYYLDSLAGERKENDQAEIFVTTKQWLTRYFAGEQPDIKELELAPRGSEFRQKIWKLLCEIPYGETTTYGELAKKMAQILNKEGMSARAVGGAVAHNPISIIIPCHRVIGTNGGLTGYAGGLDRKIKLLELEQVDMTDIGVLIKGTALSDNNRGIFN